MILALRWDRAGEPIPVGSLVKPFIALAYGERHGFQYPLRNCRGTVDGCWRPRGHGMVDLTTAIAHSCNAYFRWLATKIAVTDVMPTAKHYGLPSPDAGASGADLIGLGNRWRIAPRSLAHAYLELGLERDQPGVSQIITGMERSGKQGTGLEVDRALRQSIALVKTGTAHCTHPNREPGDGFTLAMFPAAQPRMLLLVRVHGVPGSHAARVAGEMLQRLEE